MGQKVAVKGLLWLSLGLNMDSMYTRSYLTYSLLHEGGKVNWGPPATDCIQVGIGLQESSTVLQTVSSCSGLREREVQAEQPPAYRNTSPKDRLDFSAASRLECDPNLAASPGPSCLFKTYSAQRRQLRVPMLLRVESLTQITSGVFFFF